MRWIFILLVAQLHSAIHPIGFSIPERKIIPYIPQKQRDFSPLIPGEADTYIYWSEAAYYEGYQESRFAFTFKKAGWDCLRHYEILASGAIPYFVDLDQCPPKTLYFFPKDLIQEAMHLPGVSSQGIDHTIFDQEKYDAILQKLFAYTQEYLTTQKMAEYVLKTVGYSGVGKILFLSGDLSPDYLRCLTLIGLKELLKENVIDFPKIDHIYQTLPEMTDLYGRGFTYARLIEDVPLDRSYIEERIWEKEFELIIYGSVHRGLPLHDLVSYVYPPEKIVYLCGEDLHECTRIELLGDSHFFLREYPVNGP